ncbi:proton-transporting V-type ATPase complex assembly regulator TMEM9-like [Oppia nitens]|uniref:proton-transporting V-type ATPase complex assembly regulator TMEM9-like n=1 Tax=Oppia nitens TaxID=1686743 RepID=UPI0023DC28A4|nr:proton-transporting V-type ATPase complex assembly regulator TMEM9-like [Oppia nitens]
MSVKCLTKQSFVDIMSETKTCCVVSELSMTSFRVIVVLAVMLSSCLCEYEDFRCKCVCPSTGVVNNGSQASNRKLYIKNISPNRCNCDYVVLPQLDATMQDKAKEFCPRCECKYESRNTSTIRFVVIFIIGIISFLVVYMAFLSLLDPLIHKHSVTRNYEQHIDEEVSMDEQIVSDSDGVTRRRAATTPVISPTSSGGPPPKNMLNRVGQQQTRWKKQVQEQRKNIYDKHTMLN